MNAHVDFRRRDATDEEWLAVVAAVADELARAAPRGVARLSERLSALIEYEVADEIGVASSPNGRNILLERLIAQLDRLNR